MNLSIIVLAAGKGTRMNSVKPKVFHEVGNSPMIYHVLQTAEKLSPRSVSLVISKELFSCKKKISKKFKKIKFIEQKTQLGTANAVAQAVSTNKIADDITLILYGDTPLISAQTIKKCIQNFKNKKLDLCVLSMISPVKNHRYGRIILEDGKLQKIVESIETNSQQKKINLCNSGVILINSNLLASNIGKIKNHNKKKEYYLTDIVKIFNDQKFKVNHFECPFYEMIGVNCKKELSIVEMKFQEAIRENFLKRGVTLIDRDSVFFSHDTIIGKDVIIYPNVYLGKNVKIGNNVKIKSFCHIDNTIIKNNIEVGPFARLRDNVFIDSGSKIGNFVEIKKSDIKKDVKISHLSYIGDAQIGDYTNIGAGMITCNFDGKKKNKTIIGDNCFIGSNTSLIAPIQVKDNSLIGAGTVADKDVPTQTIVYRKSELVKKMKKS